METAIQTINIHQAKTHLSRIVEDVALTKQPIIIAKAGKPRVQIIPLTETPKVRKMGTLKGKFSVPDNFDDLYSQEIAELFEGKESSDIELITGRK
ncbi:hypothetical protein BMT54_03905 [Pasteurellaceae bacterium 15-036681]|nr:hypothetical protein BMT54_03905 [Pasteurellaceae bacterium 15-036681]